MCPSSRHPLAVALAALLPLALPALADDARPDSALDPIVVTATHSEQRSFTLPMSVDAVGHDRLLDGQPGINLSETLQRVPGLVIANRQNYAQDLQVSIRGFGARSTFGTRGIRLMTDDIPASSPDGQGQAANFNLDTAQRIEVLRGPFATIYGNASGGVIRLISRDGPATPEISGGVEAGSWGTNRLSVEAGGTTSGFNYLINSERFETQGYRSHSAAERDTTNAKLTGAPTVDSRLTVALNLFEQPYAEDPTGMTAREFAANPRQSDPLAVRWDSRKSINTKQVSLTWTDRLDAGDDVTVSTYGGTRSVLQYLAGSSLGAQSSANGVVDLDRSFAGGDAHLTHRGDLFGGATEVTAGGSYELQSENRKSFNSVLDQGETNEGALTRSENDEVTATNLYLQGQWQVRPDVLLAAGLRHSLVEFATDAYAFSTPGSALYSNSSPALGASWQPVETVSVYANYGRGFETPAFSELAYTPVIRGNVITAGPALNYGLHASTSDNYEVGVKTLVDADTRLNLAAFHIATVNEIAVLANVNGRSYYQNVPGTERTGTELSLEHDFSPRLTAYGALTWLDASYSSGFQSLSITGSGAGAQIARTAIAAGNHLPGVGRREAYGELAWNDGRLSTAIETRYSDKVFANDTNTAAAGAYAVVNVRATVRQVLGHWKLEEFARVDNLFDRVYSGSVIVDDTNARYFEPSPSRGLFAGVRARYDFN